MKFLVLALCVCAAAAAPPVYKPWQQTQAVAQASAQTAAQPFVQTAKAVSQVGSAAEAQVLRSESDVRPDGFSWSYETSNGISGQAAGVLKTVDENEVLVVEGQYQHVLDDGTPFQLSYVADENGYQPKSDFLPVPHPIPEAIARSLQYIADHPSEQNTGKKF